MPDPSPEPGGSLDYDKILQESLDGGLAATAGAKPVPVDSSGMVDTWNLPSYLKGDKVTLWFDTGHTPEMNQTAHGGQDLVVGKIQSAHSFDINASAEEIMKQFAAMSQSDPMQFAALQKQLADGNFYGASAHVYGGWNKQTEDALSTAMVQYLKVSQGAGAAVSFVQFLQNTAVANQQINGNGGNGSGSGVIPPGPSLTDPDSLRYTLQNAAQQALGRNLSDDELTGFVSAFQGNETGQFNEAKAGDPHTNPDSGAEAINYVVDNHRDEYNKREVQGYADAFLRMMGISNAPDVQVAPQLGGV